MSNWPYVARFKKLDQELGGGPPADVARVGLESIEAFYSGQRLAAPCAAHFADIGAAGAGVHNSIVLSGVDPQGVSSGLGGRCIVAVHSVKVRQPTATPQVGIAVLPRASITFATDVNTVPNIMDVDPQGVTPLISLGTIAAANVPQGAGACQGWPCNGPAAADVGYQVLGELGQSPWLPPLWYVAPDRVLCIVSLDDNAVWSFFVRWQAVRI